MAQTNDQLVRRFTEMAQITELTGGNRFRSNAFERAARVLGEMTDDVSQIDPAQLKKIEGIGDGAAKRIGEYVQTGRMEEYDQMTAQVPAGLFEVMAIPGLGPKTVAQLWQDAGVQDIASLKQKIDSGELAKLKGLGQKTIDNIQKNLAFVESAASRVRIGQALPLAERIVEQIGRLKAVDQCQYAGSLRRGKETVGDIDIIAAAKADHAQKIMDQFVALDVVGEVIAHGKTKSSIRIDASAGLAQGTANGLQVDLRVVDPLSFGAAIMYFTGSKDHNVRLRERAQRRNLTLNEYALSEGDKPIARETETDIYHALDLAWIAPELREDHGEISLAEIASKPQQSKQTNQPRSSQLPDLVEQAQIVAELHAHTDASDGTWTIDQYAQFAADHGYHTIAVTDHSKSQYQANGLDAKRLEKHIENIRAAAERFKDRITILAGSEVDILADGKLDYPDKLLAKLDIVVASPHAALTQDSSKATTRLLKALENPHVSILGHATGRLVAKREGLSPEMPRLFKAAAERGVALEINANHRRLDLRDTHARSALEHGCKLTIDTDAHGSADFAELRYGILTARRAGAEKADVINCLNPTELSHWLGRG